MGARLSPCRLTRRSGGYTIVEVVLVIAILGIIGSVAGPRFFDNTAFDERGYYDEVVSALRYAQKVAVASGCHVRVDVAASTYSLSQQASLAGHCDPLDASFPLPVLMSTGEAVNGVAPAGIVVAPAVAFSYNPLGQTSLGANQTLAVGGRLLTVQADSGLVVTP